MTIVDVSAPRVTSLSTTSYIIFQWHFVHLETWLNTYWAVLARQWSQFDDTLFLMQFLIFITLNISPCNVIGYIQPN